MASPKVIQGIKQAAAQTGADPVALLATSLVESGANTGEVGDQGTSFGPFMFHEGGALGSHSPAWANSQAAILNRAQQFARLGVHGGIGAAAVQRPLNPTAYAQKVNADEAEARQLLGQTSAAGPSVAMPSVGDALASSIISPTPGVSGLQGLIDANAKNAGIASITLPAPRAQPLPVAVAPGAGVPTGVDRTGAAIVQTARKYLGVPYQWGGTNPKTGLDCSGLLQLVAKQNGINIPRTTYQQFKTGTPISKNQLQPGDAVFFEPGSSGPGHVGIYIGGGKYLDAPHTGTVVQIQSLAANPTYVGARRFT